jgi:TRAP transporter TAXI family solute receptor
MLLLLTVIILGIFLYTQGYFVEGFTSTPLIAVNNLFSLELPKILSREVNLNTKGVPVITRDGLNDFNNVISSKIQEYVPLLIDENPGFSLQNINRVNNHDIDLTFVQEELLYNAITGNYPFDKNNKLKTKSSSELESKVSRYESMKNLRFVAGVYYEPFVLLTYKDSGINSWYDIKGKTIGFPSKETGSFLNGVKIAHAYGLEAGKDFKYINVDSMNRLANLFYKKQISAIYLTTSNKNIYLINLAKKMALKFIGTNDIQDSIMKTYFPTGEVKYINTNNYYTNINTASFIKTFATRMVIVTHKDVDPEYIFLLTKTLYEKAESLKFASNNYLFNRDKLNLVEDAFMPSLMATIPEKIDYHPGAQKYYNTIYHSFESHIPKPIKEIKEVKERS